MSAIDRTETDNAASGATNDGRAALDWSTLERNADIRLVVADMDGTLLDEHGHIPDGFWPMLDRLHRHGVEFVPASGRQYATLRAMFADHVDHELSYIAENGSVVARGGRIVDVNGVDYDLARRVMGVVNDAVAAGTRDIGLIICGLSGAYVQRADAAFIEECRKYYAALEIVDDLHAVLDRGGETILKLALFDFDDAETMDRELLGDVTRGYRTVVSGAHWVDIMNPRIDKRSGVEALQRECGAGRAQTVVFGDYLNDLGMLAAADYSFAMGNAHPELKAAARYIAPSNAEHGVLTVLDRLIGN